MNYNFTFEKNIEVNRKVERDLSVIKRVLLNSVEGVDALILVGGFGRGEGTVVLNKKVQILNDYDIVIVTQNNLSRNQIKLTSNKLIKKLKIRLIDIIPYQKDNLPLLPLTIFNYDLKYASYVFFGNKSILKTIPEYKSKLIPLSEGKYLLFNRLICLTESFSDKYKFNSLTKEQTLFLVNQCAKAILAVSDSYLLLNKKYHPSYEKRAKIFKKEFGDREKLNNLVFEATNFKLLPQPSIKVNDPEKYWIERKDIFLSNFLKFMSLYYKMKFLTIDEFIIYYLKIKSPNFINKLADIFRVSSAPNELLRAKIDSAQLLILSAYGKHSVNKEFVNKALELLRPYGVRTNKPLSWEKLRNKNVELWYKFFH